MNTKEISLIKDRVKALPAEQKVELIKFLADSLSAETTASVPMQFGKYADSGRPMASESDFRIAEWHPSDRDLNGN